MMTSFSFSTFFSTFAVAAVLIATLSATAPKVLVSAEKTTTTTTITVDNWYIPYDGPKTLTANVGDTITFEWNIGHNVYIHPTMDCELDGAISVGNISPTSYTFTDADDGTDMFFACDIGSGSHCKNGQNLIVTVGGSDGIPLSSDTATVAAPTTVTEDSSAADSSGSSSVESIYLFSSMIATALLLLVGAN